MNLDPKLIFKIDGLGGLATGLMMAFVLPRFPEHFQLPMNLFYALSVYGFLCGIYSLSCGFLVKKITTRFFKPIILANLLYCLISIGVMVSFYELLSGFALAYLLFEKAIIVSLVFVEIRYAKALQQKLSR